MFYNVILRNNLTYTELVTILAFVNKFINNIKYLTSNITRKMKINKQLQADIKYQL